MGANLSVRHYPAKLGNAKILEHWESACEISLYEDGNSYSGEIGMLEGTPQWYDKQFATDAEAEEFIAKSHEKWSAPMAVSFKSKNSELCWMIGGWCSE